jgi:hypothetical protein
VRINRQPFTDAPSTDIVQLLVLADPVVIVGIALLVTKKEIGESIDTDEAFAYPPPVG